MNCAQEVFWYLDQLPAVQDELQLVPVIRRPPLATTLGTYQHSEDSSVIPDRVVPVAGFSMNGHAWNLIHDNDNFNAMDVSN